MKGAPRWPVFKRPVTSGSYVPAKTATNRETTPQPISTEDPKVWRAHRRFGLERTIADQAMIDSVESREVKRSLLKCGVKKV